MINSSVENINSFNLHEAQTRLTRLNRDVVYFSKPGLKFKPADALETTKVKITETMAIINKLTSKV